MFNNIPKDTKKIIRVSTYLLIIIILFIGGFFTGKSLKLLSKIAPETQLDKSSIGLDDTIMDSEFLNNKIITLALFGLDRRSKDEIPRSDAIMLVTIDTSRKKIKLISVMRDLYVNIDDVGKDKLNHAYFYGGPSLSLKTLNDTFNINVEDYISVDFFSLPNIIDDLGGIELDIKKYEIDNLNQYIKENQYLLNISGEHVIKEEGLQILSGIQALSYARIRTAGDGDFERTERQRKVIMAMIEKAQSISPLKLSKLLEKNIDAIETSLSLNKILSIGANLLLNKYTIEQVRIPFEGDYDDGGKIINDIWYLTFDRNKTMEKLQNYIYNDILYSE
ncbi:Cell envelope-associated transcriptional attenuator [Candidatus Arthromitus sp. SFB-mouse-NL]|uniref:LCP family protein n=1 Tax=Candidatus Arthromitus sp. SFB-mouse-NL TaxID=1508644 RepID=UPI00049A2920|nr:LCP family protein [Candidatus Arthromitus sp. SFB-mouse-NL]AID43989.1 Cell envelope-associated transcriptional attenuator [Candidatus Arthromitus sp. SFB-mouse-NL]